MKLSARDTARFFSKPDHGLSGVLIFGPDAMRIALKRQDLVRAIIGPQGEAEMRLTRISGADLRRDPARLTDAVKAQGFFPGACVVLVDEATDGLAKIIGATLGDWADGDAMIVATAGQLNARSALRKQFEANPHAIAAAIYSDPPTREEVETALARAGLRDVGPEAMTVLSAMGRSLDPGDFRQTLEKIALYKLDDPAPLTPEQIDACAPATTDAAMDDAINLAAEGAVDRLGQMLRKLSGQGTNPTTLCIAVQRHFRQLHAAASHPQGPEAAFARARPPIFGPRRDRMLRQARQWGMPRLESTLTLIMDADLKLRSSSPAPAAAIMERLFIRIAMMHPN